MARGDFVGDIVSVAQGAYSDISIASGDEVVIKTWGADSASSYYRLHVSDGTNRPRLGTADKMMAVFNGMVGLTLPVDETNMVSFYNGHPSAAIYFYYAGYKTKE
tara:strand:- start:791 stop:1105 length:315 start_codon:yes stop_codon:yes gene_type:complete